MSLERPAYHHGQLRPALLAAAEAILEESGPSGFSLRAVARRVGVSHAAPAHHFGDVNGLLAALAAEGFRRFLDSMERRQREAGDDPQAMFMGSGLGYLSFARSHPALFKLMFVDDRMKAPSQELMAAGEAAYQHLAKDVERLFGVSPLQDSAAMARLTAAWSLVHGLVTLMNAGHLQHLQAMNDEELRAVFAATSAPLLSPLSPVESR